jgi:hypothetical protein
MTTGKQEKVSIRDRGSLESAKRYFIHRKSAISGMAYFDIAQTTLPSIGLDCPIWLLGISE